MNQRSISMVLTMALDSVDPYRLTNQHILLSNTKVCIGKSEYQDVERIILIAMGKASVAMTQAAVSKLEEKICRGVCVCKTLPVKNPYWKNIHLVQGSHPVPDEKSLSAGVQVRDCLNGLTEKDLVLVLISGGASALVSSPAETIKLDEIKEVNRLLLQSGATINEMNAVRKHLEVLKGGGLARAAFPAKVHTLILSDVIGDDISTIASGPTVADPFTFDDAKLVLKKFGLSEKVSDSIRERIKMGCAGFVPETGKPGDSYLENVTNQIIGSNTIALEAAIKEAEKLGLKTRIFSKALTGEANQVGKLFVEKCQKLAMDVDGPIMVIAGGETTVTIHGNGKGGRNQELALSAVKRMANDKKGVLVTLATDGEDGPTDAAGAIVTAETMKRVESLGMDPDLYLQNNNAYEFFEKVDGLLKIGPTGTNVNDLTFYFRLE
jgi:hydroxypyruvate reductase